MSASILDQAAALHHAGRTTDALDLLAAGLRRHKNSPDLLNLQAHLLKSAGRLDEAIDSLRAALRSKPGDFALLYNLGNAQREAGDLDAATATLQRAVKRDPANPDGHNNLGATLRQRGRHAEAAASFRRAAALRPSAAPLHLNLGAALTDAGDHAQAATAFRTAATLAPGSPDTWHGLAQSLVRAGDPEAALPAFAEALRLRPSAALHTETAATLAKLMRRADALPHLQAAAALTPADPQAHTHLGTLLRDLGEDAAATAALQNALALDPDHPGARYNLGLTHLLAGRLAEGWPLYESRMRAMTGAAARFSQPIWRGEAMDGETLLLHAEQGLGDTLQFCRFIPQAAARAGARVILEVQPPLLRLLTGLEGVHTILPAGAPLPPFDRHCPLPSLPAALTITENRLVPAMPYLRAAPDRDQFWRVRLAAYPGRKIGIVWAGNAEYEHDDLRSIPPQTLSALAGIDGATFLSLQKDRPGQPPPVTLDWTAELTDIAETAALMTALDLVIAADSAMVHLAGALARPVWLLNRFDTDWRWFRHRTEDSPWYPTLRQFRQTVRGDWSSVLARVRAALVAESVSLHDTPSSK